MRPPRVLWGRDVRSAPACQLLTWAAYVSSTRSSSTGVSTSSPLSPQELWDAIEEVDQFEARWPWLEEFRLEGDTLKTGSVLHGVVCTSFALSDATFGSNSPATSRQAVIEAIIHGDLEGSGRDRRCVLSGAGTTAEVAWTVEMMQQPMRCGPPFRSPPLAVGSYRVVEITVAGFRRRFESANSAEPARLPATPPEARQPTTSHEVLVLVEPTASCDRAGPRRRSPV